MWPLLLCASLLSADPAMYQLHAKENVWDVAAEDMNGDGWKELFLLTCDEKSHPLKKLLQVHTPDAKGMYPAEPTQVLTLEPSLSTLFFVECDGKPPRELVAADAAGARIYHYVDGRFEEREHVSFCSLLPSGSKEPIFVKEAAVDLDGDGVEEWMVPVPGAFEVWRGETRLAQLPCDVASEIRRAEGLYISHRLPAWRAFTPPNGGPKGLAFLSDEYADFYFGEGWKEHRQFKIPLNVDGKWDASAKMADVTGTGFPDLAVTQTKGTINLQAQTQIYLASEPFKYPEKPTATFTLKGSIGLPELVDVDGDKKLDVVLISVPVGIKNIINYFVRGKVSVDAQVYLYNGKDFGDKPAYETSIAMDAPEGREQVAYTMGDFNGDGRQDIAFGEAAGELAVRTGEPQRLVSVKPWVTLKVPAFGVARTVNLGNKAAKDIVLYHPSGANSKRVDVIVFP